MAQNWEKHNDQDQVDDDLGSLIRWSLEDSLARETPPDDLWQRVRARIEASSPQAERALLGRKRHGLSLAPLIQTVVASSLVLAFALGVNHGDTPQSRTRASRPTVQRTAVVESARPQDIPRLRTASRPEPEPVVHQRIGGVAE